MGPHARKNNGPELGSANSAGAGQFGSITPSSGGLANLGEGIGERVGNLVTGRGFTSNAENAEWGEGMSDAMAKGDAAVNAYLRNGLPSDNTAAVIGTAGAAATVAAVRGALNKGTGALLGELSANGVKFNAGAIVAIQRLADGRIVFLEVGNAKAGLIHIMRAHGDDFARAGVSPENIPRLVMDSLSKGRVVGYQGKDMGRPIYELANGQRTAITVGNNGFIVGANPAGR